MHKGDGLKGLFQKIAHKPNMKNKLLLYTIFLISIPIVLYLLFVYTNTLQIVKQDKLNASQQLLLKTSQSIRYLLGDINEAVDDIATHDGMKKAMEDYETLEKPLQENITAFVEMQFEKAKERNPYIKQIFTVTEKGAVFSYGGESIIDGDEFFQSSYYQEVNLEDQDALWIYKKAPISFMKEEEEALFLVQSIKSIEGNENVAYVICTINLESFKKLYQDTLSGLTEELIAFDGNSKTFVTPSQYPIEAKTIEDIVQKEDFFQVKELTIQGKGYGIGVIPLSPLNWYIISIIPSNQVLEKAQNIFVGRIWLYILIGLLVIGWTIFQMVIFARVDRMTREKEQEDRIREKIYAKMMEHRQGDMKHLRNMEILVERKDLVKTTKYIQQWRMELLKEKEIENKEMGEK